MSQDGAVVLDTPAQINMFALLQSAHRLALEINTGLKFRQSTLSALHRIEVVITNPDGSEQVMRVTGRTKKNALKDLVAIITTVDPRYKVSATIKKAME